MEKFVFCAVFSSGESWKRVKELIRSKCNGCFDSRTYRDPLTFQWRSKLNVKTERLNQRDFIRQELWRTFMHLFEVCWNDYLVKYFSLLHCCGNLYKFIAFNIFSWNILIISWKTLIITITSNKTTIELTIHTKSCWNMTIFYRQETVSLFQVQEKLRACKNSSSWFVHKWNIGWKWVNSKYKIYFSRVSIHSGDEFEHLIKCSAVHRLSLH